MDELLIALVILAGGLTLTFVLPILSFLRATRAANTTIELRRELDALRAQVDALRGDLAGTARPAARPPADLASDRVPAAATATPPEAAEAQPAAPLATETADTDAVAPSAAIETPAPVPPPLPDVAAPTAQAGAAAAPPPDADAFAAAGAPRAARPETLEQRIGGRWLLYAALGSLLLGASYFVKYAFDNDWITPTMRVVLGGLAGLGLVGAGERFAARRLAFFGQMLAGGGLAILYVSAYAAFTFYGLLGPSVAFGSMVVITALAAYLADRHASQGLAFLAVTGGFLTPFLVSTGRDAQVALFTYDAILVAGTMYLAHRRAWPLLNLASFAFTAITVFAWMATYYRPAKWATTELFLTLFCAMFVVVQRWTWRVGTLPARAVAAVLVLAPLGYHVTSLGVLVGHPVWMLVYLIAVTVVTVMAAGRWSAPWLRVASFVLVVLPLFPWIGVYRRPEWLVAGTAAIVAIYAIHLLATFRAAGMHAQRLPVPEILLLHGGGLWVYGALYSLYELHASAWMGALAAGVAAWNVGIAVVQRGRGLEAWIHHLAVGAALAAVAVAVQFDGAWVTVAWAAEGAALYVIGLSLRREWMRAGGAVLLAIAVLRLVEALGMPASAAATPILNPRTASAAFVIAVLAWLAARRGADGERAGGPVERAVLILAAHTLALLVITAEIDAVFQVRAWTGSATAGAGAATTADLARQVARSTAWAAYALVLVAVGFRRRYAPIRYFAIAVFAITVAKVFLVDLSRLDGVWRIPSVIALGLLLLGASYLYQRFNTRDEAA